MFYLRNLKSNLQERRCRLRGSSYSIYSSELRYMLDFLKTNSYTRTLLETLDIGSSEDFDQWEAKLGTTAEIQFPRSEEGRAKICYTVIKRYLSGEDDRDLLNLVGAFSTERTNDDMVQDFTRLVVDPFVNFLQDRVDDAGNVLYLVERFKLKAEWFVRDELHTLYQSDTKRGETKLDRQLRANLFEGGIDYPFSDPSSPSGKADIVASLGSEDPLVLEVKAFDPDSGKDKHNLRQGFYQVLRYASDYNESLGYLVIFNCSNKQLVVELGEASEAEYPPRIIQGGKTFFVFTIDINADRASASIESPANRVILNSKDLTGDSQESTIE